jgi:hypothetical protein
VGSAILGAIHSHPPLTIGASSGSCVIGGIRSARSRVRNRSRWAKKWAQPAARITLPHGSKAGPSKPNVPGNEVGTATKPMACAAVTTHNASVSGWSPRRSCPVRRGRGGEWSLDTGAYPFHEGASAVSVCASDSATLGEPTTTCSTAQTVVVDDSFAESSGAGGQVLSADSEQKTHYTSSAPTPGPRSLFASINATRTWSRY